MRKLGETLSVLVFVMLISSFVLVSIRYLFNIVPIKFQELVVYLHSIIFMLGIVYAYARNSHVRIDIFYQNMNKEKQRKIDLFGTIFLLIPFLDLFYFPHTITFGHPYQNSNPHPMPEDYLLSMH